MRPVNEYIDNRDEDPNMLREDSLVLNVHGSLRFNAGFSALMIDNVLVSFSFMVCSVVLVDQTGLNVNAVSRAILFDICLVIQLLAFVPGVILGIPKMRGYELFIKKSDYVKLCIELISFAVINFMVLINTQKELRLATIVIYILLILVILICALASYYSKKGKIPIPVDGAVRIVCRVPMDKNKRVEVVVNLSNATLEFCPNGLWIVCRVPMDKNKRVEVVVNLSNATLEFCPNGLWIVNDETYKLRGQLIDKSEVIEVIIENDKNEVHIENIKGHWKQMESKAAMN